VTDIVAALFWYLVVSGPQGGLVVMPNGFYTRDECEQALAEYNKKPAPAGWTLSCVPDSAYDDSSGSDDTAEEPPAKQ
jgi:hypothetical protein